MADCSNAPLQSVASHLDHDFAVKTGCHLHANSCPRTKIHIRYGLTKFTIINFAFANNILCESVLGFEPKPFHSWNMLPYPHHTDYPLTVSVNVDQTFCDVACFTSCKTAIHSRIELLPTSQLLVVQRLYPDSITPVYLF